MGRPPNGALAPRLPFWEFVTKICGLNEPGSKVQFTVAQRAIWKSYDRRVALTPEEARAYRELTGKPPWKVGSKAPHFLCQTLTRGGGKTLLLATIAVYEATTNPYIAAPGETVAVVALAPRLKQSRDLMRYAKAHFERPTLAPLLKRSVSEEIELVNGRLLRCQAVDKSGGAARGPTYICALFDESAFLNHDGLVIDEQQWQAILAGARGVADFRGVLSSTPNGKAGFFFQTFDEYHGKQDAPWEVFKGPVDLVRPDMDKGLLQEFMRADPEAYKREFECDFSAGTGAQTFFVPGQIEACIMQGVNEIEPSGPTASYACAVDPSGGVNDTFTVCIVERLDDSTIRQCLARGWDPKETPSTVHEIAREIRDLVAPYGIRTVFGDVFGGQWVAEAFNAVGLDYQTRGFNAQLKLQRAAALRESFASQRIKLLDIPIQTRELCMYEQRTLPSGTVSVGHPNTKDGSDDYLDALGLAHWELIGHLAELHLPESLTDGSRWRDGFAGRQYPRPTPSYDGLPKCHLPAQQIAEKGIDAEWLMANWSKDWRYALCSAGELAWRCGISVYQWLNHCGRDLILQHQWMRWICAQNRDLRGVRYRPGDFNPQRPAMRIVTLGDFPGIPAFKEIKIRIANNDLRTVGVVSFGVAEQPSDTALVGAWPIDLRQVVATYPRGNEPVSVTPACPPFAPARREWGVFINEDMQWPVTSWPTMDYSGFIESVFRRGDYERRKTAKLRKDIQRKKLELRQREREPEIEPAPMATFYWGRPGW